MSRNVCKGWNGQGGWLSYDMAVFILMKGRNEIIMHE